MSLTKSFLISLVVFSHQCLSAENIAFGKLVGSKVYDGPESRVMKLYFDADSSFQNVPGWMGLLP